MNLLFVQGGPLEIDKLGNAYPQSMTNDVMKRYFNIADKVRYLTRTKIIEPNKSTQEKLDMSNINIISVPDLFDPKKHLINKSTAKKIIKDAMVTSDIVIVRLPSLFGNLALDIARSINKPYLIELVGDPWSAYWNHSWKGKLIAPYLYFTTKKHISNAGYVVYVTNEYLQERYPTKGAHTNCSNVSLRKFDKNTLNKRILKINNKKVGDKVIIGTTAPLDIKYKGQRDIIRALGKLKETGNIKFEYQLVGGGDPSELLAIATKYNIEEQIKFIGKLTHEAVSDWLDTIDIYAQPSKTEGLPRALIEAMSKGIPSFGSNAGGIPELLDENYIYNNVRNNTDEICEILLSFEKQSMVEQAARNFKESQKYNKNTIERRRKSFFEKFKNESIESI